MPDSKVFSEFTKWAGRFLVVLSLGFLAWTANRHWSSLSTWQPTLKSGIVLLYCSALYGVGMMFIAESWHQILRGVTQNSISRRTSWPSFGVTQIAKYLPGNVFHYVGRHLWLKQEGVTHREAILAAVWEAILMASTAVGCAALVLMVSPIALGSFGTRDVSLLASGAAAFLLLCLLIVQIVRRRVPKLAGFAPNQPALVLSPLALMGFFSIQGVTYHMLFSALGAHASFAVAAIAMIAWVVGYATPGAPGGLGSREAVLVGLTTPFVGAGQALILAALFRVATTLGDFVCFGLSHLVARSAPRPVVEAKAL